MRVVEVRLEDLAEPGGERLGFPHLTVLTTEEPGVAAWEDDGLRAQSLSDRRGRAVRQLAFRLRPAAMMTRVDAARSASKSGRYSGSESGSWPSSGSSRDPSSSVGSPNIAGSGAGCFDQSSGKGPL